MFTPFHYYKGRAGDEFGKLREGLGMNSGINSGKEADSLESPVI
jgi:hypothetical protein